MLSYWFREDEYVMTYFHPRDFDDEQPMIPGLTLSRRFKCYVGLKSSRDKLRTILSKNSFITVMDAVQSYEWNEAPRINYA